MAMVIVASGSLQAAFRQPIGGLTAWVIRPGLRVSMNKCRMSGSLTKPLTVRQAGFFGDWMLFLMASETRHNIFMIIVIITKKQ